MTEALAVVALGVVIVGVGFVVRRRRHLQELQENAARLKRVQAIAAADDRRTAGDALTGSQRGNGSSSGR